MTCIFFKGFLDSCHYNSPTLEECHYFSRYLKLAINILQSCQRPAIVVVASLEALPRGPGFDPPRGRISALGLKKTPSLVPRPKHRGARPNSQGDGPPCTGGAGVRGFSWPAVRRSFYLSNNAVGAVSPPAGQVISYFFNYI